MMQSMHMYVAKFKYHQYQLRAVLSCWYNAVNRKVAICSIHKYKRGLEIQ